ncbi:hypothetical protein [Muricomes intestini]|uniref:hypothetical protein n=1 Tax=Muricomes intestini TaxID=1796634 RepID=UPI0026A8C780
MSDVLNDPDFNQKIVIERASGGRYEGPRYVKKVQTITTSGVISHASSTKDTGQTAQGDISLGNINVYTEIPLYTTRQNPDENNISDIVIEDDARYKVLTVYDRSRYGFYKAVCQKEGTSA